MEDLSCSFLRDKAPVKYPRHDRERWAKPKFGKVAQRDNVVSSTGRWIGIFRVNGCGFTAALSAANNVRRSSAVSPGAPSHGGKYPGEFADWGARCYVCLPWTKCSFE